MKILIIDDSPLHQQSARQTIGGDHELTVVGTYDEAHELLQVPCANYEAVEAELNRRGFVKNPYDKSTTEEERRAHYEERKRVQVELCPPPSFEAVLADLLMPASRMTMGDKGLKFVGQEMPVGFALALMASLHGAKYVGVVTDTNHHDHPASAWLDPFASRCPHKHDAKGAPPRFDINGAKVGYYHSPMTLVAGTTCPNCDGTGSTKACYCLESAVSARPDCQACRGTGRWCPVCGKSGKQAGKDWGRVLQHLLGQG